MIVVSDTTPIHYLILTGHESILPDLFDDVIIPDAVVSEMSHHNAPARIRDWVSAKPNWAIVRSGSDELLSRIHGLGRGETSAIAIAIEVQADAVLLDDRKAIREADRNGLSILTTFGLLELASRKSLIDFEQAVKSLSTTNFHLPPDKIVQEYLRRNR